MWAFLVEQPNLPYTIAFACVLFLGVFEALALLIGLSMLSALDQWVPTDVDYHPDMGGGLTGIAGWLCLNRLPLLIWFVLALTSFAIAGYLVNFISLSVVGVLSATTVYTANCCRGKCLCLPISRTITCRPFT